MYTCTHTYERTYITHVIYIYIYIHIYIRRYIHTTHGGIFQDFGSSTTFLTTLTMCSWVVGTCCCNQVTCMSVWWRDHVLVSEGTCCYNQVTCMSTSCKHTYDMYTSVACHFPRKFLENYTHAFSKISKNIYTRVASHLTRKFSVIERTYSLWKMCVRMYVCMYVCMYVWKFSVIERTYTLWKMCVRMYVCMYVWKFSVIQRIYSLWKMYVYMYVCLYMYENFLSSRETTACEKCTMYACMCRNIHT
jgi:hypothetical protein